MVGQVPAESHAILLKKLLSRDQKRTTEMLNIINVCNFCTSYVFIYLFIMLPKKVKENQLTCTHLDLFELLRWKPKVTVYKMKPLKHIINQMFTINPCFIFWSITVFEILRYKIWKKATWDTWDISLGVEFFVYWQSIDDKWKVCTDIFNQCNYFFK